MCSCRKFNETHCSQLSVVGDSFVGRIGNRFYECRTKNWFRIWQCCISFIWFIPHAGRYTLTTCISSKSTYVTDGQRTSIKIAKPFTQLHAVALVVVAKRKRSSFSSVSWSRGRSLSSLHWFFYHKHIPFHEINVCHLPYGNRDRFQCMHKIKQYRVHRKFILVKLIILIYYLLDFLDSESHRFCGRLTETFDSCSVLATYLRILTA